jgi:pimeloyl-ACP methyl ester carboxylesterase
MVDIFVGGFGDGYTGHRIVVNYFETYKETQKNSKYYDWNDSSGIISLLDSLPDSEDINLIGHSYGGDSAGNICAHYKRSIKLLITVDPVGKTKETTMVLIKSNCKYWVDINAEGVSSFNLSNIIAGIGDDWDDTPKNYATVYAEVPFNHEDFGPMMRWPLKYGRSAEQILRDNNSKPSAP